MPRIPNDKNFAGEKSRLLTTLAAYHRRWNQELVEQAFDYAVAIHKDQKRQSGEPFFSHPLAVAHILAELKTDYIAVTAGLLHDVVEDSPVTIADIEQKFGPQVALLVDGVTKISELKLRSWEEQQAETIRKMLISMLKDLRVILIKFADRLHNMRTLDALPVKSQQRIAMETRDIYAPLAARLGIARISREMDDLALKVLDRKAYDELSARIDNTGQVRQEILDEIIAPIRRELDRLGIQAEIDGRVKSVASIYNKIHQQRKRYDEIYDLLAIRIIVQQKSECYRVLGLVHDIYTPVTEHFTDYIALPKSNLYQSLHTKIVDANQRMVEVQIRTEEMHQFAENGFAAHWRYKEGQIQPGADDRLEWIRSLMEMHQEGAETGDFMESLRIDLVNDEIFVFTPKGRLVQLPQGATAVDFAFAIHSDIGLHAIGAKVSGKIIPLSNSLESGAVVEILTSPKQRPSAEWLKFVRTSRARYRIKRWFRETRYDQARSLGEEMITAELARLKLQSVNGEIDEIAISFGFNETSDFFVAIGEGSISLGQVMRKLVPRVATDREGVLSRIIQRVGRDKTIRVGGLENLALSIADCCNPLPGDPIIGFQSTGRGVVVHRTDCRRICALLDDERKVISVAWDVERDDRFFAKIQLVADDRPNLLLDITQVLALFKVNIVRLSLHIEDKLVIGSMTMEVRNLPHLTRVIGRIHSVRGVLKAERMDEDPEKFVIE